MNENMAGVIRTLLDELKPSERRGAAF